MRVRHEIFLPKDQAFYTTNRVFEVSVDTAACGTFIWTDNTRFTLAASAGALAPLLAACPREHSVSLKTISEGAMRFYRSGGVHSFSEADHVSMLFMTRYLFGHAFAVSRTNSVEHAYPQAAVFHGEALAAQTELFAYCLACHFAAKLLGVPIDRFFFITADGARADFHARVTATELRQKGVGLGALAPAGFIVELEVKARTGWASFRSTGWQGLALLKNLHAKVALRPARAFLGMIVALPGQPGAPRTRAKIVIADPGDAVPIGVEDQTILLLEQAISLLYQHGLWPTLARALAWLQELRPLHERELELRELVDRFLGMAQYRLEEREYDGRMFNGRTFTDVVARIGQINNRRMSIDEAEERLRLDDLGHAWYSGIDVAFVRVIEERAGDQLRHFGVRGQDANRDLSGGTAFRIEEEPMTEELRESVRNVLRLALRHW